jgi:peptidoglycan/LPS O-acetylase OafA/YrhL
MSKIGRGKIPVSTSIFLDILRLGAALIVFFVHADTIWFPEQHNNPNLPADLGHAAVVIFFVLSGYLISYTTINNNRGSSQYGHARLSKLYSVLVPGLLITAVVQWLMTSINPILLAEYTRGFSFFRYLLTFGFLNELWFFSLAPPINRPLWSLGYEFWYYVIYGLWFFRRGNNKSFFIILIACVIAGPKVLLMMPVWLVGALAYKLPKPQMNQTVNWLLIIFIVFIAYFVLFYFPPYPRTISFPPLFYSGKFVSDYILGVLIAGVIWLLPELELNIAISSSKGLGVFREVADLTFPLYVLHAPILIFFKALIDFQLNNLNQMILMIVLVFVICSVLGFYINRSKKIWDQLFSFILARLRRVLIFPIWSRQ